MKHLFTANLHNKVVIFAKDLETLIRPFSKCEPTAALQSIEYHKKEFEESSTLLVFINDEKVYTLQQVY